MSESEKNSDIILTARDERESTSSTGGCAPGEYWEPKLVFAPLDDRSQAQKLGRKERSEVKTVTVGLCIL